jgi:hypothetical protein
MTEPKTELINLIGARVKIIPLGLGGKIYEIQILRTGVCAWVRYLYNMDILEKCFYFDELEIENN